MSVHSYHPDTHTHGLDSRSGRTYRHCRVCIRRLRKERALRLAKFAPAGAPTAAVERHGADGVHRPSPSAPEHVPAHEVRLIEPDGRVWWMVGP